MMGSHRRNWGWWLVMAFAVAVAASLLYRRCATAPDGSSSSPRADSVLVVQDTVFVNVDGETVPVITERPAEPAGERPGQAAKPEEAPEATPEAAPDATPEAAPAAGTVIAIPVSDITGIIRKKSGRDITVSTKAPDHIDVSYAGKVDIPLLGEQDVDFAAGFKVVEVQDDRMVLQMDSGTALNLAADLVAPLILERLPAGLVESYSNGRTVVNLKAIPQYSKRLSGYSITGITVDESNIRFETVKK